MNQKCFSVLAFCNAVSIIYISLKLYYEYFGTSAAEHRMLNDLILNMLNSKCSISTIEQFMYCHTKELLKIHVEMKLRY